MKSIFRVQDQDQKIIHDLADVFQDNDRMKVMLGKGRDNFLKRITHIISYSYFMVKKIGGIFISKDQNTYLLYYTKKNLYFSLRDCLNYFFLAFVTIGIQRLKKVYLREKRIKNTRKKEMQKRDDKDYLYVWFIGQKREHQSLTGLVEAKKFIIERATTLSLPIYMETTEERLVPIYERMGFEFYDCLIEEEAGLSVWFGRYC